MNDFSIFPENSYSGICSCNAQYLAPKGTLHCSKCLYGRIAELEAENAELRKQVKSQIAELQILSSALHRESKSQWISVEDRLPEIGDFCLAYMERRGSSIPNTVNTQYTKYGFERASVTHWMPLPNKPSGVE